MKISAPIITLLAGGALAGGLVVANGVTAGGAERPAAAVSDSTGADTGDAAGSAAGGNEAGDQAGAGEEAAGGAEGGAAQGGAAGEGGAAGGEESTGAGAGGGAAGGGADAAEDAKKQVKRTFAGRTEGAGKQPLLAISVRGETAIAYLCDGKLEVWYAGTAKNGRLELTAKNKKASSLTGTFDAEGAEGDVNAGDRDFAFDVKVVKKPSGLWRAAADVRGARVQGGWVVLEDGTQVGVVTRNGVPVAAPRIDTAGGRVVIDGQALTVVATDPETGAGF